MKKVLVLTLVLSVASLATAGLSLVPDATLVNPGDVVTVQVIQDAQNFTGSGGEMTVSFAGIDKTATDTTPGFTEGGTWLWAFNSGAYVLPAGIGFGKVAQTGFGTYGIGSTSTAAVPYVSTIEFSFKATETTDLVWGGVWDGVDMGDVVGATITVVPEPATMVLLGLGALVLRRKK